MDIEKTFISLANPPVTEERNSIVQFRITHVRTDVYMHRRCINYLDISREDVMCISYKVYLAPSILGKIFLTLSQEFLKMIFELKNRFIAISITTIRFSRTEYYCFIVQLFRKTCPRDLSQILREYRLETKKLPVKAHDHMCYYFRTRIRCTNVKFIHS